MTPLSAPRVWLLLWSDVHNNFNPPSTEFDKSKNQEEISIISNILIVILCSTKEYLEGPKTAAYVNNKIKLSYRIITEGIFIPKLSSDWSVWDSVFLLDETLALLSLRTGEGGRIPRELFFSKRNFLDVTNISFHMNNIFLFYVHIHTMSKYSSVRILFYLFVLMSQCQIRQTRLMHHRSWKHLEM